MERLVIQARSLLEKKSKGNDVYVVISLGKEKYRTSVQEQTKSPYWNEECDLVIPQDRKPLKLKVFHRSLSALSSDDFLGQALIPIQDIDMDAQPRAKWYTLESKPSKKAAVKERGELEVKISFIVKSQIDSSKLSAGPLGKRTLSSTSIGKIKKRSGSLLSLSKKATSGSVRNLASSVGKVFTLGRKKDKNKASADSASVTSSIDGRDSDLERDINTNPFEDDTSFGEKAEEPPKKGSPIWGKKNNGGLSATKSGKGSNNSSRRASDQYDYPDTNPFEIEMNGTKDHSNENKTTNGKKSQSNNLNDSKSSPEKESFGSPTSPTGK
ncbi:DgyrCDS14329 [Dimorphilus gyrociliatus]|uniref:DgyrCDS14329 n=1 Tax=Dimorphilus gyrociliatus TaxID=2664684 RepID=A0A7I8WDB5_9ANNE|nr:DgyrCDS14329 [Dimorphilus gyrociliatus]